MTTARELLDLLNSKVQFRTPEGDYEGVIARVFPESSLVRVQYLYFLPERINFGCLNFRFHEMTILKVITHSPLENENAVKNSSFSYVPTGSRQYGLLDDYDYSMSEQEDTDDFSCDEVQEKYIPKVSPNLSHILPNECKIIDNSLENYDASIEHIKDQDRIGLSLEGHDISRNGELSFLNIVTKKSTLMFDIKALGKEAFNKGLKCVLQDPKILKVVHDCRQVSDCLYHKYQTRLVNVFDTQVGDLFYRMTGKNSGKLITNVSPLNLCLAWYLEVPEEYLLHHPKFGMCGNGKMYFLKRPLKRELFDIMVHNVIYLLLLHREVEIGMATPFRRAVDIYLNSIQASSEQELLVEPPVSEKPPKMLFMDDIKLVSFKEHIDIPEIISSGPPYRKIVDRLECYLDSYKNEKTKKVDQVSTVAELNNKKKADNSSLLLLNTKSLNQLDRVADSTDNIKFHKEDKLASSYSENKSSEFKISENIMRQKCLDREQFQMQESELSHSKGDRNKNEFKSNVGNSTMSVSFETRIPTVGMGRGAIISDFQCNLPLKSPDPVISPSPSQHIDWSVFECESDDDLGEKKNLKFVPAGMGY